MSLLLKSQSVRLSSALRICQSVRNTWVFRHVVAPPKTPEGAAQRKPDEFQDLMKYEVISEPKDMKPHTVKVILLEDVEGVGHQFDIVEFDHEFVHEKLLLPKKATYASPFDLDYYMKMKEQMKDQLAARIRVPYEYVKLGRSLMKKIVPVHVSMDNQWKINSAILQASLFEAGIKAPIEAISIPEKYAYSGPNFELEASLLRFYVVINKQYVVPVIGRLAHISANELKKSAYPNEITRASKEQLDKFGIRYDEQPYYHRTPELDSKVDIIKLMQEKSA